MTAVAEAKNQLNGQFGFSSSEVDQICKIYITTTRGQNGKAINRNTIWQSP